MALWLYLVFTKKNLSEGYFQIFKDRSYYRVVFGITLHKDYSEILYKIQKYLEIGKVTIRGSTCTFRVYAIKDLINILIPLLDLYTLRTTKFLDYLEFRKAVCILTCKNGNSGLSLEDKTQLDTWKSAMNSNRTEYVLSRIPNQSMNKYWLVGFISFLIKKKKQGEGTFGLKNLIPYFQIGQHERSAHVIKSIQNYLCTWNNLFTFSINTPSLTGNITRHKTAVLVLSYSNIDSLYGILAMHLLDVPFQSRKKIDFMYWCLSLYMHKHGHYYQPLGRQCVVEISNYINTSRYTTSGKGLNEPEIPIAFLNTDMPVKLTPTMTHHGLALKMTSKQVIGERQIWVYDNKDLVEGSPFNTNVDVALKLGLNKNTSIIKRYLDTDKLYLKRYSFYTRAKSL